MAAEVIQAHGGAAHRAGQRGAEALQAGKLVGFATETVYGVAAAADNPKALQRLRDLKDRPERPFSVHMGRTTMLPSRTTGLGSTFPTATRIGVLVIGESAA